MSNKDSSLILRGVDTSVDMFVSKTKMQGLNISVRRVGEYINKTGVVFVNQVDGMETFTKDIVLLYEIVFYTLKDSTVSDITTVSKSIIKKLKSVKFSLKNYFLFKYDLDSFLRYLAMSNDFYSEFDNEYMFLVTLNMIRIVLDICLFSAHDRSVVGLDLEKNKVLYSYSEKVFDMMNGVFRGIDEAREFVKLFNELYEQRLVAIRLGQCNVDGATESQLLADINDKVDDNLRLISATRVVVSIINSLDSSIKFPNPTVDSLRKSIFEGVLTEIETSHYRGRKIISNRRGNLLVVRDERSPLESVLVKDVVLDNFVCIAVSYRTRDGLEDAFIMPLRLNTFLGIACDDVLRVLEDFYGLSNGTAPEYEVLSPHYWKYRLKRYTSEGDKRVGGKIEREHKVVEIGAFLRKADNHSQEAEELARKYCLDLKKGYTLVRPHKREYGKLKEEF